MRIQSVVKKSEILESNDVINNKLMDELMYPMFYEGDLQYIQVNPFVISQEKFNEIKNATNNIIEILNIISKMFRYEKPYLQEVFVTKDERYLHAISQKLKDDSFLTIYGRFDFAVNSTGNIYLLENNADTPAGIIEATHVTNMIHQFLGRNDLINPNAELLDLIVKAMDKYIIGNLGEKDVYNMSFACVKMATEDYYNVKVVYDYYQEHSILKDKINFDFIDMSDIKIKFNEKGEPIYAYSNEENVKMDIIYRFYPMEWLCDNSDYPQLQDLMYLMSIGKVLSVNPPHSMSVHSKGILSLLYEIYLQVKDNTEQQLFSEEHILCLKKYILPAYLEFQTNSDKTTYVAKPFFDREGANIKFVNKRNYNPSYLDKDLVYQKKIKLKKVSFYSHDKNEIKKVRGHVVLSSYAIGNEFGGILVRVGNEITDKEAYFFPTFIQG